MTTSKKHGGGDDVASALTTSVEIQTSVTRDAVETLARRQGQPVLDVLTQLQGAAAHLDDGEVSLNALGAIKTEILIEQGLLPAGPHFPHVTVQLIGQDGNIFNVIGLVCKALRKGGATDQEIKSFTDEIERSGSYDQALAVVMRWVEVS